MPASEIASDAQRMDRHYRFQRHIYDSTRTHYLIGRRHLIDSIDAAPAASVLEIGCGTAWNLIRVAQSYPEAHIYGIDVSRAMLDTAQASVNRRGLAGRIHLRQGDATSFDPRALFGCKTFDRIFFSYALSMIPKWEAALAHAATCISPGGRLLIVDFGQCDALPTWFKKGLFKFLDHYSVMPRATLNDKLTQVAAAHGMTVHFEKMHRGYTDFARLIGTV